MSDRMTMMRRVWPGAAALVLAWLALAPPAGRVSAAAGNNLAPAPVFLPLAPSLARARIPVYLPAWLPAFPQRVYLPQGHGLRRRVVDPTPGRG